MDYTKYRDLSLGEKLQMWRTENQLSQSDFADLLRRSQRTVGTWERNEKLPGFDSIVEIVRITGAPPDWILGIFEPGIEPPFP